LQKKEIGGVALGVVTPEPYPTDGDLLKKVDVTKNRESLVLTPHVNRHTNQYTQHVVAVT